MIDVIENKKCCGCGACLQVCPKQCIEFVTDTEGFCYPKVYTPRCVDCHLCENVCPMFHPEEPRRSLSVESMRFHKDRIRIESSSGGVFTALAEAIINREGVVFGASWTEKWQVEHRYSESLEGLAAFRGSKYLQSDIRNSYQQARDFLREGRWVLFSGTPCQCKGLKLFLNKEYDKLIIVDFICHGVPSYKVFRAYLKDEIKNYIPKDALVPSGWCLKDIRFRDKTNGWKKYSFALTLAKVTADGEENTVIHSHIFPDSSYMKGFGANLYLRPSCHSCPARKFSSGSDFTLADYWGIEEQHPELDDDKGTSLVAIHSEKAEKLLEDILLLERQPVDAEAAYKVQICLRRDMFPSCYREEFWASDYENDFSNIVNRICQRRTVKQKTVNSLKYVLRKLGVKRVYQFIKRKS